MDNSAGNSNDSDLPLVQLLPLFPYLLCLLWDRQGLMGPEQYNTTHRIDYSAMLPLAFTKIRRFPGKKYRENPD